MGMEPGVPQVQTPSAAGVGNSFQGLLQQLYGATPGMVNQQNTFLPQFTTAATNNLGTAAGGVLGTYLNSIIPGLNLGSMGQSAGNVGTVAGAGPGAASAIGDISPETMGLDRLLGTTASTQLDAANTGILPANQADQTLNAVNQNWASRGMGGGSGNELDAALQYYLGGENNLAGAESAAGSAINTEFNTVTSPALSVISPALTSSGQAMDFTGATPGSVAAGSQQNLPSQPDLQSLMNLVYNSQAGADISQANVSEAQNQAQAQLWSGIVGGGLGAL